MRLKKIVNGFSVCLLVASFLPLVNISPFSLDVNADDTIQTSESAQISELLKTNKYLDQLPTDTSSETAKVEEMEQETKDSEDVENSTTESSEQNSSEAKKEEQTNKSENINEEAPIQESVKEESTEKSLRLLSADAETAEVTSWGELKAALTNSAIKKVLVNKNITVTDKGLTVNRKVEVDFQNHLLNLTANSINLGSSAIVTFKNFNFTGNGSAIFTGSGTARFSGIVKSISGSTAGIAQLVSSSVIFDNVDMTYDRGNNTTEAITAKNFSIINGSKVQSESIRFYGIASGAPANATVLIDGESKVITNSNKSVDQGQAWILDKTATMSIQGKSSLEINGNTKQKADYGAVFVMGAASSQLNVLERSSLVINSTAASAIILESSGGKFTVDDHSSINLKSAENGYSLGATLRFRLKGGMTFNITKNSKIEIEKTGGAAPAIRMYGGKNVINISGKSDLIVKNKGNGKVQNPGTNGSNQGIQYTAGGDNQFNLLDEKSSVLIKADSGAAIDAGSDSLSVKAATKTYFIARGKTATKSRGIFNAGVLNFAMDSVSYFDFSNENEGRIFENNRGSNFNSKNSNLSVWKSGANLKGNPTYAWNMLDFTLSAKDFSTLNATTDSDMKAQFGSMTNYSRMTANNQSAIIDEVRVPTDADKKIYVHAIIPEEKGVFRDAYSNEVKATVGLFDSFGKQISVVDGLSNGNNVSVYGDTARKGMIEVPVSNNQFLKVGQSIKVLDAWKDRKKDGTWVIKTEPDNIVQTHSSVLDVTPPNPTKIIDSTVISPAKKILSGTGEVNSIVRLSLNGVVQGNVSTMVDSEGNWTLSIASLKLKKHDILQVFLQDQSGKRTEITSPPVTNNEIGNINPSKDMIYHDAIFKAAPTISVVGQLVFKEAPKTIDFGTNSIKNTTIKLAPIVSGNLIVSDTRDTKQTWKLTLNQALPLTNETQTISDVLSYIKSNGEEVKISSVDQVIEQRKSPSDDDDVLSGGWNTKQDSSNRGLRATIPVDKQVLGDYKGTLSWKLQDVPGNE